MAKFCSTRMMTSGFLRRLSTKAQKYLLLSSHPGAGATTIKGTSLTTGKILCARTSMTTFSNAIATTNQPSGAGGLSSGIALKMSSKTTQPIRKAGWITHVAVIDKTTEILYVTTCTSRQVTTGDKVTIPSWKVILKKPT